MGLCILFWAFVSFPPSPLLVQRRPCHRGKGTRRSLGTWQLLSCSLSNFDFSLFNWEASQCLSTQALCAPRPSSRSVHCAGFSSDWNIQLGGGVRTHWTSSASAVHLPLPKGPKLKHIKTLQSCIKLARIEIPIHTSWMIRWRRKETLDFLVGNPKCPSSSTPDVHNGSTEAPGMRASRLQNLSHSRQRSHRWTNSSSGNCCWNANSLYQPERTNLSSGTGKHVWITGSLCEPHIAHVWYLWCSPFSFVIISWISWKRVLAFGSWMWFW